MQNELKYRTATPGDKEQLKRLSLAAYGRFEDVLGPEHWLQMKASLQNDAKLYELLAVATTYVCEYGGTITGMAHLVPNGNPTATFDTDWCYIRMVGVDPAFEGRGIAKTLTKMCIERAMETNEKIIALHTSEFMDAARHIYESMGFKKLKDIGLLYGKQYWVYTLSLQ